MLFITLVAAAEVAAAAGLILTSIDTVVVAGG